MSRPELRKIPMPEMIGRPGTVTVTIGVGEWDSLLADCYNAGFLLLELDDNEHPVAAYQKEVTK